MIETCPAPWSEDVFQVRQDGRYIGEVRRSAETDDFIYILAVERHGQTLPLVIGRADSIEDAATKIAAAR